MALIGLDGFSESLGVGINASDTVLPVSNGAGLCTQLGANTSKLLISDGIYWEIVYVTGCVNGLPQVVRGREGSQARSFTAGSCVQYILLTSTVCDLINSGGCSPDAACVALNIIAGRKFPDAETGLPFSHVIAWTGSTPVTVTVLTKPSWMTVTPTGTTNGNSVVFSGTAGAVTDGDIVQIAISNCGKTYETNQRLDYCTPVGATV